jgi:CubicO group peptidase (beta-lactamase class C family)|tara:strand:- start:3648 stop:4550 length:903 start_codon:yes stop_codon:yes gene_type:complete
MPFAFEQNFLDDRELGASIACVHEGELVVNLWAGHANLARTRPWAEDTLPCVFSTTKLFTVTCALIAVDRGLLDLDPRVAHYWPAFGQGGKETVTVRDVLTHRALMSGFRQPQLFYTRCDWEKMLDLIEREPAWFEPGTFCYHLVNNGFIIGHLVHIVTGIHFQKFFIDEPADPLGADIHLGLTDPSDQACVPQFLWPPETFPFEEGTLAHEVGASFEPGPEGIDPFLEWRVQSMLSPAESGYATAVGLARFASMLANGGHLDGREYLSPEMFREAQTEQVHAECPLLGEIRFGLGLGLD